MVLRGADLCDIVLGCAIAVTVLTVKIMFGRFRQFFTKYFSNVFCFRY